jgi:adsorption protein B
MAAVQVAGYELALVAAVGILLLGLDDLLFDAMWLARGRQARATAAAASDCGPAETGPLAIFVPAWQEAAILPATVQRMLSCWRGENIRIYLGCYLNDAATLFAVSRLVARDERLRLVIAAADGPTSKADNLNQMWQAMGADERTLGLRFAGVVLHDAEDMVHPEEIALYRAHLPSAAMVQIPVEPLLTSAGALVAAHYADEFAEAHAKELVLRSAFGAGLPSAGVGCAFTRRALTLLALERPDGPFNADSLTEDYEVGLTLAARGLTCRFVTAAAVDGGRIATRSAFPATLEAAVRQKGRWITGIAFAAWDRLDWGGARVGGAGDTLRPWSVRLLTAWMLWRDRRAALSAVIILVAYVALLIAGLDLAARQLGLWPAAATDPALRLLLVVNALLLCWRLAMRAAFVAVVYGWRQGLLAIPRAFVSNIIHMLAARRALVKYGRQICRQEFVWDKTHHDAPVSTAAPAAASRQGFGG